MAWSGNIKSTKSGVGELGVVHLHQEFWGVPPLRANKWEKKIAKLTNRLVENFSEAMIVLLCYYITDMKSRISARMISSEGNQVW